MSTEIDPRLGWRILFVKADGNWFRAVAVYRDPRDKIPGGPRYCLSDRGRTRAEACRVLLEGCKLDPKYPHLMRGLGDGLSA